MARYAVSFDSFGRFIELGLLVTLSAVTGCGVKDSAPEPIEQTVNSLTTAAHGVTFRGGPQYNKIVNVLFYGLADGVHPINGEERADTLLYLDDFFGYLAGANKPSGTDPTVRLYGIWGAVRGSSLGTTDPFVQHQAVVVTPPHQIPRDVTIDQDIRIHLSTAHGAGFGGANLPPIDAFTLDLVIVPADAILVDPPSGKFVNGYHNSFGAGHYAVAKSVNWNAISHEILEAMTDPTLWDGWATEEGFLNLTHYEGADGACDNDSSDPLAVSFPAPAPASFGNLGPTAEFVSGNAYPAYGYPAKACSTYVPAQYSPIAVIQRPDNTWVYTVNSDGNLYRTNAIKPTHQPPTPTVSMGKPPTTSILGKPSAVDYEGFDVVFLRGADGHLWANVAALPGNWGDVGSPPNGFFGDPSAIVWNNGAGLNVFVLGADGRIWSAYWTGAVWGWAVLTQPGFSGPPIVFSRSPTTLDVFALGVDRKLYRVAYDGMQWFAPSKLSDFSLYAQPGISSWGGDRMDVFFGGDAPQNFQKHLIWSQGRWTTLEGLNQLNGGVSPSFSGGPSGVTSSVSWGPGRIDAFTIDIGTTNMYHSAYTTATGWQNENHFVLTSGATEDPVVTSPGYGMLNVYYRDVSGMLRQLEYLNNAWTDYNLGTEVPPVM